MKRIHTTPVIPSTTHAHAHKNGTALPTEIQAAPAAAEAAVASPTGSSAAGTATGIVFIGLPPASASIPVPPKGWTPRPGEDYRGTQPKKGELSTLGGAIGDLERFTDFTTVLGATVPPLDHVMQLLVAGNAWSTMLAATAAWDVYAGAQEGMAWGAIRGVMDKLRPSFDLAVSMNSALATKYPALTSLLGVQKVIARKAASTRAANKTEKAAGKPETHGKVGKARQRAAEKAALEAANAAAATPEAQTAPAPANSHDGSTTAAPAAAH